MVDYERLVFQGPEKSCGDETTRLKAVFWRPKDQPVKGTIVYLHPGAFRSGTPEGVDDFARQICARGMGALSLGYRLGGGEADLSAGTRQVFDALAAAAGPQTQGLSPRLRGVSAFCAIEDVIDMLNATAKTEALGDLGPLILFGDSAGGIAALTILGTPDLRARCAVDIHGAMILSGAMPYFDITDPKSGPPILWYHCEHDPKVSAQSAQAMAEIADQRAQPTSVHVVPGRAHGWFMFKRKLVPDAPDAQPFALFWDWAEARFDAG